MSRVIIKEDKGPFEVEPQDKSVYVCRCGLSKNQPFCDGSHNNTQDEEDGKLYRYNNEGHREEVEK